MRRSGDIIAERVGVPLFRGVGTRRCLRSDLPVCTLTEVDVARFWRHVQKSAPNECWEWTGHHDANGYGRFAVRQVRFIASRLAWQFAGGAPPADHFVCHRCDNPGCVNPAHLFLGDNRANMRDMALKGRQRFQDRSTCAKGHSYSEENTYRRPRDVARRTCRACAAENCRNYRARKAAARLFNRAT